MSDQVTTARTTGAVEPESPSDALESTADETPERFDWNELDGSIEWGPLG